MKSDSSKSCHCMMCRWHDGTRGHGHHCIIRMFVGVVIALVIFSFGCMVGAFHSAHSYERGFGNSGGYGRMMGNYRYGGPSQQNVQDTSGQQNPSAQQIPTTGTQQIPPQAQ